MYHPPPRPIARIRVGVLQLRPPGDGYSRQMSFMMAHMLGDGLKAPPLDSFIFATFATADCGNFHPPRTHTVIQSLPSFVYSSFRQNFPNDFIYSTRASTTRRVTAVRLVAARVALSPPLNSETTDIDSVRAAFLVSHLHPRTDDRFRSRGLRPLCPKG